MRLSSAAATIRRQGIVSATGVYAEHVARPGIARLLHRWLPISLRDALTTASVHASAEPLLAELFGPGRSAEIGGVLGEFPGIARGLATRAAGVDSGLAHPASFSMREPKARLLYAIVRLLQPESVLETGVADGHSTFVTLMALRRNGQGRLVSVDVSAEVGGLLLAEDREGWTLRVLDRGDRGRGFRRLVAELPGLDLFLHDSQHTYRWQQLEYSTAAAALRPGGVLASDDIVHSYAFFDHARGHGLRPLLLTEGGDVLGAVRMPGG